MKQVTKIKIFNRVAVILTFTCTCLFSRAAVPPQQLTLELAAIKPVEPRQIKTEDVGAVIPTNLQPGQKEADISLRIADKSINSLSQGDYFKNSEAGKVANGVQNAFKTQMTFGGTPEQGTEQKLNMQILAFEQKAYIHYEGYANIQVTYKNSDGVNIQWFEKLGNSTSLVVTHVFNDSMSRANISWNW